jgi:hypothetical protein
MAGSFRTSPTGEDGRELRLSNAFLDSSLRISRHALSQDARELRFIRFNQAGEEFSATPDELLGRMIRFFTKEQGDSFTAK